jgi:dihydrofolate synthase/folylpolyglutamate synthase
VREGLRRVRWPGRFEILFEHPTVILDGAHNPEGVKALVDELNAFRQGRRLKLLFATMADKEWELMLRSLAKSVDEIVFTRVGMERSADPQNLEEKLSEPIPHRVITDSQQALRALIDDAEDEDVIIVAGSLYLLGEVRPMLDQIAKAKLVPGQRIHRAERIPNDTKDSSCNRATCSGEFDQWRTRPSRSGQRPRRSVACQRNQSDGG